MKKLILFLFITLSFISSAQVQMSQVSGLIPKLNSKQDTIPKGTGFLKRSGSTWSYDPSTYLTSFTESDPIYSAWNKSTGISITTSQVSDFPTSLKNPYTLTFNGASGYSKYYDGSLPISITYSDVNAASASTVSFPGFGTTHYLAAYGDHNHAGVYEPVLTSGYPNQYYRGDKTWQLFPTTLSSFTNDLGNYGGWITGINSGMVTTALGYTPEQSLTFSTGLTRIGNTITNNITQYTDALARSAQTNSSIITALGYTPYDVSNPSGYITSSALSGYLTTSTGIQNQNSSPQSANMWINGIIKTVNPVVGWSSWIENSAIGGSGLVITASDDTGGLPFLVRKKDGTEFFKVSNTGAATFSSTVNSTGFLLNGNNLTSSLITNYIPKWNGSNFINSLISDDGVKLNINNNSPRLDLNTFSDYQKGGGVISDNDGVIFYSKAAYPSLRLGRSVNSGADITTSLSIDYNGNVNIPSTTASTSPTTGALVIGGGMGVGGALYANGLIVSATGQGFKNNSYQAGYNRIWSFGSGSEPYGLGYYQGTSTVIGSDAIGFHFGDVNAPKAWVKNDGSITASSFSGSGSNLTGVQLPITLTTNGTSGAATFSGNTLNVPNYVQGSVSSGSYVPTFTSLHGLSSVSISSISGGNAFYQNIGGYYTVNFHGSCVCDGSYSAPSFNFSLPSTATALEITGVIVAGVIGQDAPISNIGWTNSPPLKGSCTMSFKNIGIVPNGTTIFYSITCMYH